LLLSGLLSGALLLPAHDPATARRDEPIFDVFEASIPDLQAALTSGRVTSRKIVQAYLARIAAYDQRGPGLNAVISLNSHALDEADRLDRARVVGRQHGPLFGVPLLIKDNFDTADMPTSGGTLALATLQPERDAALVARLRDAGAIILGKTSMHELAVGTTTESSLTGRTRNPYDPRRSPGGSSGGSAAAVAASFAAAAMGTDTCGSLRIPAAYQNLVTLRGTRGLSSRAGIIPLSSTQDIPGPLARTVTDLAILLDATVGIDEPVPSMRDSAGASRSTYQEVLQPGGLKGKRIGVLRMFLDPDVIDGDTLMVVSAALEAMKAQGAELIDITIPELDATNKDASVIGFEFQRDLAAYLSVHRGAPVVSLDDIISQGLEHEAVEARLKARNSTGPRDENAYAAALALRDKGRALLVEAMAEANVAALAYPTALQKPMLWGGEQFGKTTCRLSATTGLPAVSMPLGLDVHGLPVGLDLLGRPFDDASLLRIAYAWEQAIHPRRAPFSTPPLRGMTESTVLRGAIMLKTAGWDGVRARIRFSYEPAIAMLTIRARSVEGGGDGPVVLALHRGTIESPGPVLAPLLWPARSAATTSLYLDAQDRDNLKAGRLFVRLYTRTFPLGAVSAPLKPAPDWRR